MFGFDSLVIMSFRDLRSKWCSLCPLTFVCNKHDHHCTENQRIVTWTGRDCSVISCDRLHRDDEGLGLSPPDINGKF